MAPINQVLELYPLVVGEERVYEVTIYFVITVTEQNEEIFDTWTDLVHQQVVRQYPTHYGIGFDLYYPDYPEVSTFPLGGGRVGDYTESLEIRADGVYQHGDPKMLFPLEVGKEWLAFGDEFPEYKWRVNVQEDVHTPSRDFSDCYPIQLITGPDSTTVWYCDRIGIVKEEAWHHPAYWMVTWTLVQMP
jgi:hypothetical protein